jgi:hypothetical protein
LVIKSMCDFMPHDHPDGAVVEISEITKVGGNYIMSLKIPCDCCFLDNDKYPKYANINMK